MLSKRLPIDLSLDEVVDTFRQHSTCILQAPPGAGKTTRVPLKLLTEDYLSGQKIVILEPRRLAASNAARFMANQLNEKIGQTVGYSIRYQRRVSSRTKIEFVTEGILTRRLQNDPELKGTGLVIFDEFHERHLESDLALALCRDIQSSLRQDLKILIMSATLDCNSLANKLKAPLLTCEGTSYPVHINYLPGKKNHSVIEKTVSATRQAIKEVDGDILVFLPGESEIRQCQKLLSDLKPDILLCPLFGNLPFSDQEKAIQPDNQRKVVLATNIAETSLTIEGISVVVDSGYSRQPRFDSGSGLNRLELGRISQASATQRSGRAGRLTEGHCYRLWSGGEHDALLPFTPPEIRTADLSSLVLNLLSWGVSDPEELFWLDTPSPSAWQKGIDLLDLLGALNPQKQLNSIGQNLAELPTHPRLARLLVAAKQENLLRLGCDLVALLSERDPWRSRRPTHKSDSDILDRLEAYWHQPSAQIYSSIDRASRYWQRFFNLPEALEKATTEEISHLLLAAFPDRVCLLQDHGSNNYQLSSGKRTSLGEKSALDNPGMMIAIYLHSTKSGKTEVTLASRLDMTSLEKAYPELLWKKKCYWDFDEGRLVSCEQKYFGALIIKQRPCTKDLQLATNAILAAIQKEGLGLLKSCQKTLIFRARVQFLHSQVDSTKWPDLSDKALLAKLGVWLQPYLGKASNRAELKKIDVLSALKSLFDWHQLQELEKLAPEKLLVPSGSQVRLQYPADSGPILAVKLQEMFGQIDTPMVAGNRVPVVVHLLSPAGRPLQITQDLRHFWEHSYLEVKKEMSGRYPKHPWPDDPFKALPTAKTKRKLAKEEK